MPRFEKATIDASLIYKNYYNLPNRKKLKAIVKETGVGECKRLHNSEYDAQMTLKYIKLICEESGMPFAKVIAKYSKPLQCPNANVKEDLCVN